MDKGKLKKFKKYLLSCGAEVLDTTNQYELVRFRANGVVSIIYEGRRGYSFVGEAEQAYRDYVSGHNYYVDNNKASRKNMSVKKRTLLERDGYQCFYCLKEMDETDMTVEHLLSINHGGSNHMSNLVLAHCQCNQDAGHLSLIEKIKLREKSLDNSIHNVYTD